MPKIQNRARIISSANSVRKTGYSYAKGKIGPLS